MSLVKTIKKQGFELSAELFIAESAEEPAHDGWLGFRVIDTRFGGSEMPLKFVFPMYQAHEPGSGFHERADAEFILSDDALRYLEVADRTRHAYAIPEGIRAEICVDFPDYRYGNLAMRLFSKINEICQKQIGHTQGVVAPSLVKLIHAADELGIPIATRTVEFPSDPPPRLKLQSWAQAVKGLRSGTRVPAHQSSIQKNTPELDRSGSGA